MAPRLGLGGGVTADPASGLFGAPNLLLDNFPGAHRAYSVRKLSKDYSGYAMKVRNDDDETADISFNDDGIVAADSPTANLSGSAEGATLAAFVADGTGDDNEGWVDTWYDQSGNGSNATSNAPGEQPLIYNGGSLVTCGSGGTVNTALTFRTESSVSDTSFLQVSNSGLSLGDVSVFWVAQESPDLTSGAVASRSTWWLSDGANKYFGHILYSQSDNIFYAGTGLAGGQPVITYADAIPGGGYDWPTAQRLFSFHASTSAQTIIINGVSDTGSTVATATDSFVGTASNLGIGHHLIGASYSHDGPIQEFIVYDSHQTSNNAGIVSDINTAFSIY